MSDAGIPTPSIGNPLNDHATLGTVIGCVVGLLVILIVITAVLCCYREPHERPWPFTGSPRVPPKGLDECEEYHLGNPPPRKPSRLKRFRTIRDRDGNVPTRHTRMLSAMGHGRFLEALRGGDDRAMESRSSALGAAGHVRRTSRNT